MTTHDINDYTGFYSGWIRKRDTAAQGADTDQHIADAEKAATAAGYVQLGRGLPAADAEVVYLPTCSSPGFKGKCERLYYSRWVREQVSA